MINSLAGSIDSQLLAEFASQGESGDNQETEKRVSFVASCTRPEECYLSFLFALDTPSSFSLATMSAPWDRAFTFLSMYRILPSLPI